MPNTEQLLSNQQQAGGFLAEKEYMLPPGLCLVSNPLRHLDCYTLSPLLLGLSHGQMASRHFLRLPLPLLFSRHLCSQKGFPV